MRRQIISAVVVAAILYGSVPVQPAHALFGVGDIVFDPSSYAELVQEAKQGLEQLQWLANIYTTAQKDLQTLTNLYNLFAHATDAVQLVQELNSQYINSPLLTDAVQIEQAFSGLGLKTSLAGKINAIVARVRYYQPSNNDFSGFHLNKQVLATAGQQSSAQDALTAATNRITGLNELMGAINTDDPKKVQDLTARGTIETAKAVAQANQLQAAQLMQQAAKDSMEQQRQQAFRFSVDKLRQSAQDAAAAAAGGAVNLVSDQ